MGTRGATRGDDEVTDPTPAAADDLPHPDDDVASALSSSRLTDEQERHLWGRWRDQQDPGARGALIVGYLWLVRRIAQSLLRKIGSAYLELRDLIQLGTVGLMDAVERFNPTLDVLFPVYATKRIRGAILNELERLSEYHAQYSLRQRRSRERIRHLDSPARGLSADDVFEEMTQLAVGLAVGFMLDGTGLFVSSEASHSPYDDPGELLAASDAFLNLVQQLPEQERQLVALHYQSGMQFTDIATVMNLTRGRISQIHTQAITRLRTLFKARRHLDVKI